MPTHSTSMAALTRAVGGVPYVHDCETRSHSAAFLKR
jgi:hypothetical protein